MVIFNMKMLRQIEEEMVCCCFGADVEIVIDFANKAVYLQWNFWREIEMSLSRKVSFMMIEGANLDVLKAEARLGSTQFELGVIKILKEKGL